MSRFQAEPLLEARRQAAESADGSTDLGRSRTTFELAPEGAHTIDGALLPWPVLQRIAASERGCFVVTDSAEPIRLFSPTWNRFYNLYATPSAPTFLISGVLMHRIKDTDPRRDTASKVRAAAIRGGRVLDTCTGLGYTAIEAAGRAEFLATLELDSTVHALARLNPWSHELFDNPVIHPLIADCGEVIRSLPDRAFSTILHDPPVLGLAGELYAESLYRHLLRILRPGGRLFHYIGDPQSASGGRVTRGVVTRLATAGFHRVRPQPEAYGVSAVKPR